MYCNLRYCISSINRPGRLLNFWTLKVGAYSRWALIWGWTLIEFSPFLTSVVCIFCKKTVNGNNKTRRCNKARFLQNTLKKTPSSWKSQISTYPFWGGSGKGVFTYLFECGLWRNSKEVLWFFRGEIMMREGGWGDRAIISPNEVWSLKASRVFNFCVHMEISNNYFKLFFWYMQRISSPQME